MRLLLPLIAVLVIGFFKPGMLLASRPAVPNDCLVQLADSIVIGIPKGYSEQPYLWDHFGPVYVLDVEVTLWLKGEGRQGEEFSDKAQLAVRKENSGQVIFSLGRNYLIFIEQTEAGPVVLNGGQGAVLIEDNHALLGGRRIDLLDYNKEVILEDLGTLKNDQACGPFKSSH